jgi:hypothetical protein
MTLKHGAMRPVRHIQAGAEDDGAAVEAPR